MSFLTRGLFEIHTAGLPALPPASSAAAAPTTDTPDAPASAARGGGGGSARHHFEVFAFALNPADGSEERRRVVTAVEGAAGGRSTRRAT
eukprot:scaffold21899_cov63-Phaeocystis_antarctica.AAC.10